MKHILTYLTLSAMSVSLTHCGPEKPDLGQFPSIVISNDEVRMVVYLPDTEKGLYRATRFDWSGVIGSVRYRGHEYFGYWKDTHDPMFHEDLAGPVEGFIEPGLGYAEAEPGGKFIRIGVGVIEKADEPDYNWMDTYRILDHGKWTIDHGKDWISFAQEVKSEIGYGYLYEKTIRLKSDGFTIEHNLQNRGQKAIETDQFNHNFFMIDGKSSGPPFSITFPFEISTGDDLKGYLEIDGKELRFIRELKDDTVFLELEGYGSETADHRITVTDRESGTGVTFSVDRPLARLVFWACETTLCPENSVWISVEPGKQMEWTSVYSLFAE